MDSVVIFDGDNTLWDTNMVFTRAQKSILNGLAKCGYPTDPDRDFALLRRIDDSLVRACGKHEYDPSLLAYNLLQHFKGNSVGHPTIELDVRDPDIEFARKLGAEFLEAKAAYPPLFPDVMP